jgi:3D (Asp-Asp-Asp) domain-containing protein
MPLLFIASLVVAVPALNALANPLSQTEGDSIANSVPIAVATATVNDAVLASPKPQMAREDLSTEVRTLVVTATAYNSVVGQTDSDPTTAAWGDSLSPGMKTIAVSRDLIPLGLDHRAPVSIEGMPGEYRVLDKMNGRWSKRIDIYMGNDVDAAITWGRREVRIHW